MRRRFTRLKGRPVTATWNVMSGAPCVAGTRIPIQIIQGALMTGSTLAELAEDFGCPVERLEKAVRYAERRYPIQAVL